MINQELVQYIKRELLAGSSKEKIYDDLKTSGGWTDEDIDNAFLQYEISTTSGLIPNTLKHIGIWLILLYTSLFLFLLYEMISDTTGWGFILILAIPFPIIGVLLGIGVYKKNISFYKLAIGLVVLHTLYFVSMLYEGIITSRYGDFDIKESAWLWVTCIIFLFTCFLCIRNFLKIKRDNYLVQKNIQKSFFVKIGYLILLLGVFVQYMFLFQPILISFMATSAPFGERTRINSVSVEAEKNMRTELEKLRSKGYKIRLGGHSGTEYYVDYSYSIATKNGVDYMFTIYTFDTIESLETYIKDIPYIGPYNEYIGAHLPYSDAYIVYKKETTLFMHKEKDPVFISDVESLYGKPVQY